MHRVLGLDVEGGLGLPTWKSSLPSLKHEWGGRKVSGGVRGDWEEGRQCKYFNGKIKKNLKKEKKVLVGPPCVLTFFLLLHSFPPIFHYFFGELLYSCLLTHDPPSPLTYFY